MKAKIILFIVIVALIVAAAFFMIKPKTSAPTVDTQSSGTDKVSDISADLNSATMTADVDALFKDIDNDINKL